MRQFCDLTHMKLKNKSSLTSQQVLVTDQRRSHYGLKREIFSGNYLRTVSYRFWVVDYEFTNFFPCLLDSFWVIASWSFAQITSYCCALTLITFFLVNIWQNYWLIIVGEDCPHISVPNLVQVYGQARPVERLACVLHWKIRLDRTFVTVTCLKLNIFQIWLRFWIDID